MNLDKLRVFSSMSFKEFFWIKCTEMQVEGTTCNKFKKILPRCLMQPFKNEIENCVSKFIYEQI